MPVFKEDKRSTHNNTKLYAKKGDKVKIVVSQQNTDVVIVEDKHGNRFPCTKDELL